MTPSTASVLGRLTSVYDRDGHLALMFDYDGTLAPLTEHPRLAKLPSQMRRILGQLTELPRVNVGILSGRGLADLNSMVDIPGLFLAGTSGLELDLRGVTVVHPKAGKTRNVIIDVAELLQPLVEQFPGAWLEKKRIGLTVHYRGVALGDVDALITALNDILGLYIPQIRVVEGPKAVEITPDLGWTKGTAVRMILAGLPREHLISLYAGDNYNDVEAFQAVSATGGMTIGVGSDAPSMVDLRMSDVTDLQAFLEELVFELFMRQFQAPSRKPSMCSCPCTSTPNAHIT